MSVNSDMRSIMLQKKKLEESKRTGELIERWIDEKEINVAIYKDVVTKYVQDVRYRLLVYSAYTYNLIDHNYRLYDKADNTVYSISSVQMVRGLYFCELEVIDTNG